MAGGFHLMVNGFAHGNGVFVTTGNNLAGATTHADSEEVARVTGLGAVDRATGVFYPTSSDAVMTSCSFRRWW